MQCEQSRAEVKAKNTICGIVSGYEYVELDHEWPRHHWRDWSDAELRQTHLLPERYDQFRRARLADIQYAPCEDTKVGHRPLQEEPDKDHYFWGMKKGQCMDCGAKDVAA
ncbi:hypothetical protein PP635_gp54 [Arthrobacter phage Auxilium]|uniref:Uncharacterized protein n=1 Tax=Arthrobacter phage Auxilium TaxID=2419948 RepID=A0A3G2KA06_9CAUD|nr:hypothetical protein PP635_gp54 [Arthrobacter phage Auxilium]AYN55833.1 hypothetical protein PBI_AUXILIUM_54 [Arthrobacter phage Auxilium]